MKFFPGCENIAYASFIRAVLFDSDSVILILLDENAYVYVSDSQRFWSLNPLCS